MLTECCGSAAGMQQNFYNSYGMIQNCIRNAFRFLMASRIRNAMRPSWFRLRQNCSGNGIRGQEAAMLRECCQSGVDMGQEYAGRMLQAYCRERKQNNILSNKR